MKKLLLVAALSFISQFAFADPQADCAAKAVTKDGKPLAGAARSSFMKKCVADSSAAK